MRLHFHVEGQQLHISSPGLLVGESINYLDAQFTFSQEWEGLAKTAYFTCGDNSFAGYVDGDNQIKQGINLGPGAWTVHVK